MQIETARRSTVATSDLAASTLLPWYFRNAMMVVVYRTLNIAALTEYDGTSRPLKGSHLKNTSQLTKTATGRKHQNALQHLLKWCRVARVRTMTIYRVWKELLCDMRAYEQHMPATSCKTNSIPSIEQIVHCTFKAFEAGRTNRTIVFTWLLWTYL